MLNHPCIPGTMWLGYIAVWTIWGILLRIFPVSSTISWSCSNSCPLSRWCYLTIPSSAAAFPSCLSLSSHLGSFSSELTLHIRWPKYWNFSLSPSIEYSGLISLRIDWFDLLAVPGTLQESSPAPQFISINSLALSLLCGPALTSVHECWKNRNFDCVDLCWQSDVSAFWCAM